MTCPVTIRFTPQLNEDINDLFYLQAETGPFEIPLICASKKAIAKCSTQDIDFNQVIIYLYSQVIYGEDG